jgi:AcrR family transcriptional regulator
MERATETDLYDRDFALWVKAQVDALREGRLSAVDVENVTEELEALAKRDRRELKNRLRVLGAHLLKRSYQPEKASRSWDATILEQSTRIRALLEDSPSLRRELPDFLFGAYSDARELARVETGIAIPPLIDEPLSDNFLDFLSEWCHAASGEFNSTIFIDTRKKFDNLRRRT